MIIKRQYKFPDNPGLERELDNIVNQLNGKESIKGITTFKDIVVKGIIDQQSTRTSYFGSENILPHKSYFTNLGSVDKKFLTINAAELNIETLVARESVSTIGGRVLIGSGSSSLVADISSTQDTIDVKHNGMTTNDIVYLEGGGQIEFIKILSAPTTIDKERFRYTVQRDLDSSGANKWTSGSAVFNTGQTGEGFIDLYSVSSLKGSSQTGPTIVGNIRNSLTYNDWTEHWAIGQLNGLYGYTNSTFGVGLGEYSTTKSYLTVDSTNGIRMLKGTSVLAQWNTTGVIAVGEIADGKSYVEISAGTLEFKTQIDPLTTNTMISLDVTDGVVVGDLLNTYLQYTTSGGLVINGDGTALDISTNATIATVEGNITTNSSNISQNATDITLRVKKNDVINQINISTEGILIDADNIKIDGTTTFTTGYDPSDKAKTFRQATAPVTGMTAGDIWIDTDDGDRPYSYNGTSWIPSLTIINGGNITTGTINASLVTVTNLNATNITTGTLDVARLSVSSLDAISANLGSITAGNITLDTSGYIKGGQTAYNTGTGFYLGYSGGGYKFSIGSSTKSMTWDGANLTVNGGIVSNIQTGSEIGIQGWQHDMTFSSTDFDTLAWSSGTIYLLDGTTYSITAGNTGNIIAITYIYLDTAVSITTLQTTTTSSTAIGSGKIMIAVAQKTVSGKDILFQVFGGNALGGSGKLLTASNIAANTITANEIYANTITASEIKAGTITATEINTSTITTLNLTAGTIDGVTITGGVLRTNDTTTRVEINSTDNALYFYKLGNQGVIIKDDATDGVGVFLQDGILQAVKGSPLAGNYSYTQIASSTNFKNINMYAIQKDTSQYIGSNLQIERTVAGSTIGYYADISGIAGGTHYGVLLDISSPGTTNYGIHATASGATTNWAGYFEGDVKTTGTIKTADPGSGAGSWKLGTYRSSYGQTIDPAGYIEVMVDGTLRKLALATI